VYWDQYSNAVVHCCFHILIATSLSSYTSPSSQTENATELYILIKQKRDA